MPPPPVYLNEEDMKKHIAETKSMDLLAHTEKMKKRKEQEMIEWYHGNDPYDWDEEKFKAEITRRGFPVMAGMAWVYATGGDNGYFSRLKAFKFDHRVFKPEEVSREYGVAANPFNERTPPHIVTIDKLVRFFCHEISAKIKRENTLTRMFKCYGEKGAKRELTFLGAEYMCTGKDYRKLYKAYKKIDERHFSKHCYRVECIALATGITLEDQEGDDVYTEEEEEEYKQRRYLHYL